MPDRVFPIVPIMVNTYYPPAPSAKRCLDLGAALRRVIEASRAARASSCSPRAD